MKLAITALQKLFFNNKSITYAIPPIRRPPHVPYTSIRKTKPLRSVLPKPSPLAGSNARQRHAELCVNRSLDLAAKHEKSWELLPVGELEATLMVKPSIAVVVTATKAEVCAAGQAECPVACFIIASNSNFAASNLSSSIP